MVREFYANAKFCGLYDERVMVRGKTVNFSASAINRYFSTLSINDPNEYEEFARQPPSLESIGQRICTGPSDWVMSVNNEPVGIPRTFLTIEAWDWLCFVNTRLYPSSHSSEVNKDQAALIYAILTDVPLDIGRYMHNAMKKSARGGLFVSLYFPSLITALCEKAGLVNQHGDELVRPDTTINEENLDPSPPPAQRRQRRPRELAVEDKMAYIEEEMRQLCIQQEQHMLEQRQCWNALFDHLQVPPNRRPNYAPGVPGDPIEPDETVFRIRK